MKTLESKESTALGPGTVVSDRYRLSRKLGSGGMGQVFLAVDERIGREVAIKFLRSFADDHIEERFQKELAITGALAHPNVISIFDTGRFNDLAYFVMEYIEGSETLSAAVDRHVKSGSLVPLNIIREWFVQATRALKVLHDKHRAWHRDLKPDNLLVYTAAGDPYLKILDFGLVRAQSSSLTDSGTMLGTPAYMAPEWFQEDDGGEPLVPDHRADLFSLGLCLYMSLTGKHPYPQLVHSDAKVAYLRALKTYGPRNGLADNTDFSDVSEDWARVTDRLLENDREKRFQTAAALERSLDALSIDNDWRTSEPQRAVSMAASSDAIEQPTKAVQRNRLYASSEGSNLISQESAKAHNAEDRANTKHELQDWSCDEHHCYACWREVGIMMWRREVLSTHVEAFDARWGALARRNEKFGLFTVILPGAPSPKPKVRSDIARLYNRYSDRLKGVCTCFAGGGVSASIGAMSMSTMNLLLMPRYPYKVTDNWRRGAEWLSNRISTSRVPNDSLVGAVKTMETRFKDYLSESKYSLSINERDFSLSKAS